MTNKIKIALAAALVAAFATPVLAQEKSYQSASTYWYSPCGNPRAVLAAGPYVGYNPCTDPNAVFVGGTYAGSDPDPNIRAALIREFARR